MAEVNMDFDAMIAACETQIAALNEVIESLKKAQAVIGGFSASAGRSRNTEIAVDEFTGLNITDAAEKFLSIVGRPARPTQDIVKALSKGGLERVTTDSVSTMLLRSHNGDGKVVRVQKGLWGLESWYGKRPSKIKRNKNGNEEDAGEENPEVIAINVSPDPDDE